LHELEFRDFSTFEQKYFPQRIVFRERDRVVLEVRDISITKPHFAADAFVPQESVPGVDTCDDPVPVRKIKDVTPEIPKAELLRLRSAEVYLFALIGTDGAVQKLSVPHDCHLSNRKDRKYFQLFGVQWIRGRWLPGLWLRQPPEAFHWFLPWRHEACVEAWFATLIRSILWQQNQY
jgi:hypothetical protein